MLKLAIMAVVAASTAATPTLVANAPWWERVTMTMTGDGQAPSCQFVSSLDPGRSEACELEGAEVLQAGAARGSGVYTKITFERRFTPGTSPKIADLQPGDTLLGKQVMALAIDGSGQVRSCQVLAASGDLLPSYGCQEARAERFRAASAGSSSEAAPQQGYLTITVYGHSEQVA